MTQKAKNKLPKASNGKQFFVYNGGTLSDLNELHRALTQDMTDEQYKHHVQPQRNDFAAWVEDVFGHASCASKIRRKRSKHGMAQAVAECIDEFYSS
jgi:uncharacterized protein YeeX (DUF496 family)